MKNLLKKLFGTKKDRDVKMLEPYVGKVHEVYDGYSSMTDNELRGKSDELRQRIKDHTRDLQDELAQLKEEAENTKDINRKNDLYDEIDKLTKDLYNQFEEVMEEMVPEAFSVVKETARRLTENGEIRVTATDWDEEMAKKHEYVTIENGEAVWSGKWLAAGAEIEWKMVHYDVQLMGGTVLHQGKIAEMATGEGKTLVATLPVFLNALTQMGVHLVTVNPYLARRDMEWNRPVFQFHNISVDCIDLHQPNSDDRRKAYQADVTYGTNNEFGFDYLRDNMTTNPEFLVQKNHFFAIIDEIDSVLIDEARTPLIISGPVPRGDRHEYNELKPRIERLVRSQRKLITAYLTDAKKKIAEGNDGLEEKQGGLALFRAFRGLPKNNALIKYLSEPGVKTLLNKVEGHFLQDNQKNMPIADEPLFFTIDEKNNQIELTDKGRDLITQAGEEVDLFVLPDIGSEFAEIDNDTSLDEEGKVKKKDQIARDFAEKSERLHAINQLVKAYTLFEKDVEYIVDEGKVMIVDEQTGRALPGRRYSDGLHQAIEAKENVKVEAATQTFATVTLQNYFRMYHKLAGMTGTAETEEKEFYTIYKLEVVVIPTNRPIARDDRDDLVFKTKREKYNAVIDEIIQLREEGKPVLVGTTSVEVSELLARMLKIRKIKHNVLNAKHHQREAEIVAEAGQPGAVTIATNMAGRGTDIKLGEGVKTNGGLAIIGTERHESRRIDRQLRGRAGRQGDPGQSQFYVSLEDDLMRLFGTERISRIMDRMGLEEGEVIQHSMITRSISNAQKKVEENNFGMRKRLLEYDDVMNAQREVIYKRRRNALYGDRIKVDLDTMLKEFCQELIDVHIDMTDAEGLKFDAIRFLRVDPEIGEGDLNDERADKLAEKLYERAQGYYNRKSEELAETLFNGITRIKKDNPNVQWIRIPFSDGAKKFQIDIEVQKAIETKGMVVIDELEKIATLHIIDENWKDHLRTMDDLRRDVQNAVYEQKDPLLIYKIQSFEVFRQMMAKVNQEVLSLIFKTDLHIEGSQQSQEQVNTKRDDFSKMKANHKDVANDRKRKMEQERRVLAAAGGGEQERKLSRAQRRAQERKSGGKKKRRG
ncbi:MAG: preprotein translocase subunit SecA [Bacteroidia bacterium]|nr:preprotein translocase subunit SecA [Bacteroidia bacterium]